MNQPPVFAVGADVGPDKTQGKQPMEHAHGRIGHEAAGALEGLLSVLAVHHRLAPAAINIDDFDASIDLDVVRDGHRALPDGDIAVLNNSFGFGGHNGSLVIGPA